MHRIQERRQDILNIQYNQHKGLTFSWNFRGLSNQNVYFRHLFVFNNKITPFLDKMLINIFSKIKIGDFFAIMIIKDLDTQNIQEIQWIQKTSFNNINISQMDNNFNNSFNNIEKMLQFIGKQTIGYNDPVIVTFCLQNQLDSVQYKQFIEQKRINNQYPYFVNFISNFEEHSISVSEGFNDISLVDQSICQIQKIYKALSYQTAILSATIELQTQNFSINNKNGDLWKNIDFNKLKRCYYGPSLHYKQDFIQFVDELKFKQDNNMHMTIKLQVNLYSGKKITSNKIIFLKTNNMKSYMMTKVIGNQSKYTFQFAKMIRSRTQPFCSTSFLFYTKLKTQNKTQNIKN